MLLLLPQTRPCQLPATREPDQGSPGRSCPEPSRGCQCHLAKCYARDMVERTQQQCNRSSRKRDPCMSDLPQQHPSHQFTHSSSCSARGCVGTAARERGPPPPPRRAMSWRACPALRASTDSPLDISYRCRGCSDSSCGFPVRPPSGTQTTGFLRRGCVHGEGGGGYACAPSSHGALRFNAN